MIKKCLLLILCICAGSLHSLEADSTSKKQQIANQLYEIMLQGGDRLGYSSEILSYLKNVFGIFPDAARKNPYNYNKYLNSEESRRQQVDPYSLLSGGLAIRESLQLESIRPTGATKKDIKLSSLKGPQIKSHPFEEMLKNRKSRFFPLSSYCPEDFYYLHFNSMSRSLDFFDYLSSVGGSLHKRFSPQSVNFGLKEKILTQLSLKENKAARKFYDYVIDEMAIVGSDPFIIEGSDITVIYKLKIESVFFLTISRYRSFYKEKYNAQEQEITILGKKVNHLFTADRKINSFLLRLNDVVLISNSPEALKRVIRASKGTLPAMSGSADFRYMRSLYPADKENEDAFVYLSDAFIRRLVGPGLRIKEARRMAESRRMALLEKYIIYYYHLTGKMPASLRDITGIIQNPKTSTQNRTLLEKLKSHPGGKAALLPSFHRYTHRSRDKFISKLSWYIGEERIKDKNLYKVYKKRYKEFRIIAEDFTTLLEKTYRTIMGRTLHLHSDALRLLLMKRIAPSEKLFSGLSIIENTFKAQSAIYGTQGHMKSNLEIELDWISKEEAARYKKFIKEYNNFWKDYFDPIGVRIKLDRGIKVETCILPLINNSIYNTLTGIIGGTPIKLNTQNTIHGEIFTLSLKINKELLFNEHLQKYMTMMQRTDPELKKISLADILQDEVQIHIHDIRPLVDFDGRMIMNNIMRSQPDFDDAFYGLLAWSLFHPIRVSFPLKKPEACRNVLRALDKYLARRIHTRRWSEIDNYTYDYKGTTVRVFKYTVFHTLSFRIYYAITDGALNITSTKDYMERILEDREALEIQARKTTATGNIAAIYRPGQMLLEKELFKDNVLESARKSCFRNFGTIRLLGILFPGDTNLRKQSLSAFGFEPICPMGGEYLLDRKTGKVTNSIFGSRERPVIRYKKIGTKSFERFFSTKEIRLMLEFTKEGIQTELITR